MKQTAVEWLIEQLTPSISLQQKHIDELKEKAKAMEKEQIKRAFEFGVADAYNFIEDEAEQYYNETYKK
jgi:FtsZ-binding cell division protein ZapB